MNWLKEKRNLFAPISFAFFLLFIPISPTLKSLFLGITLATVFLTPEYIKNVPYAFNSLLGRSILLLLSFILIATIWSPAPYTMQWAVVSKYLKLIYLPFLAVCLINPKAREWSINGYLCALFITCVISFLKSVGFFVDGAADSIFYNYIITGFMVSIASYFALLRVFKYKGWLQWFYIFYVLLASYQLFFINTSRTGYIIYFILMLLVLIQKCNLKYGLMSFIIISGLLGVIYTQSSNLHNRVNYLISDVKYLQQNNQNTSLGYRLQFHRYAQDLLLRHPLTGIGTGGFKYSFNQEKPLPAWGDNLTDPHSQYWFILAEQGLIGLALYAFFMVSLFITSLYTLETRSDLWGMLTALCIGSVSDTIFSYSAVGYLLIAIGALSLGELIQLKVIEVQEEKSVNKHAPVLI